MLSIWEVKELLGKTDISDEEAERLRNACYQLAELALASWRSTTTENTGEHAKESVKEEYHCTRGEKVASSTHKTGKTQ